MLPLTKALWSVHVWMMAFTTLFANISPCQCVCPNGHRKLFCLGICSGTNRCCCNGANGCCGCGGSDDNTRSTDRSQSAQCPRVKPTKPRCCCCHSTSSLRAEATAGQSHIKAEGCRRTLSQAKLITCPTRVSEVIDHSAGVTLLEAPSRVLPIPTAYPSLYSRERCHPPPPTDLIVAFQHLII
jgi:hypothetical protein